MIRSITPRWAVFIAALLPCWGIIAFTRTAAAEISTEAAVVAVQRHFCRWGFWVRGRTLPAKIRKDGDLAYVGMRGLIQWDGARRLSAPSDYTFALYTREGEVAVWRQGGLWRDEATEQKLLAGPTETIWVAEPTECNIPFVDTPMKLRFLKVVEETMAKQLFDSNKRGFTHLPPRVEIIVKNFNFDDFGTSVLVPKTRDVWTLTFHNGFNPLDDTYLKEEQFPAKAWDPKNAKRYRDGILAKGLRREIQLHE